jgi:hypothetical protein
MLRVTRHPGFLLPLLLTLGMAACGGAAAPTAPASPPAPAISAEDQEDFPADASATHFHPMHHAAFGPLYGSGCPNYGPCGCGNSQTLGDEVRCQLTHLKAADIPVTAYLFDGDAWSMTSSAETNSCSGPDCCSWKLGDPPIQALASDGVRALLHFWGGCHDPEQYQRAYSRLGKNLLGFYLDDGSSDDELQQASEYMQATIPGDWEVVAKAYQNREPSTTNNGLSKWANTAYIGDLTFEFEGLSEAVERLVAKGRYIPAPYAEFTGYNFGDTGSPDEEIFYRRLAFGALQPVMAHTPYGNSDPWRPEYSPELLDAYRYYAWLHKELVPYFYSYMYRMYETPGRTLVRRGAMPHSLRIGNELYLPVVTEPTRAMDIVFPSGRWIDYWDESQVYSGAVQGFPVPLGREPIFIREGSIIPMDVERSYTGHGTRDSAGALTLLVFPNPAAPSTFRYRSDARDPWVTFTAQSTDSVLTIDADVPTTQPVLYRISRWPSAPAAVSVDHLQVVVSAAGAASSGTHSAVKAAGSEAAVNASRVTTWFYDGETQRLVVKAFP